jgi:16S rRNA (cytosine1402-N4)-methyltransferase
MGQSPDNQDRPYHVGVMISEVVALFAEAPSGLVVDATYGGGGHSRALLLARPSDPILAIDRDPDAMANVPPEPRLRFVAGNFGELRRLLSSSMGRDHEPHESHQDIGDGQRVAGVLFDLGVSSHQLDVASRGFSYRKQGPLDMRMDPDGPLTAGDLVNQADAQELERIFRRWGEERFARRIAHRIVAERPIEDTVQLADVIAGAVPAAARRRGHPARRVFQALRIEVNEELGELERGLDAALESVDAGGRVVVISYHSLEDRLVKKRFAAGATGCVCPPDLPVCGCGQTSELRLLTRGGVRATTHEVEANPRARSAIMRAAEVVGG